MTAPYPKALEAFPVVRQSLLANFQTCGLATKFDIDHGHGSHRASGGTILHRAIAKCLNVMLVTGEVQMEPDVAIEIFEEIQRQHDVPMTADGFNDTDVIVSFRELAEMRTALRMWCKQLEWNPERFSGIEKRLQIVLSYPDGAGGMVERPFSTQLDLYEIDDSGEHADSWDWKSSWQPPAKKERDPEAFDDSDASEDGYFQQIVHAVVLFINRPRLQTVRAREYYPRAADDPVRERTFHRYELPALKAMLDSLIERFDKAYESQEWEPVPGTYCATHCLMPGSCTVFKAARRTGAVTNAEDAKAVVEQIVWLEGLLKVKRSAATAYFSENPAETVRGAKHDKAYGPVVRERTTKPSKEQVEEAVARGVNPGSLFVTTKYTAIALHNASTTHPFVEATDAEEKAMRGEVGS